MDDSDSPHQPQRPPETLGVFDLVLVIVRNRVLILATTLTCVLLGLGILGLRLLEPPASKDVPTTYRAQVTVSIAPLPAMLVPYFDAKAKTSAVEWLSNPSLVVPSFQEAVVQNNDRFSGETLAKEGSLTAYVQDSVIDKTYKVSPTKDASTAKLTFDEKSADRAKAFLQALIAKANTEPKLAIRFQAKSGLNAVTGLIVPKPSPGASASQAILVEKQAYLAELLAETGFPFVQQGEIQVRAVNVAGGPAPFLTSLSLFAVISFGGLLGSILLSFLVEAVRKFRLSEDQKAKLSGAIAKKATPARPLEPGKSKKTMSTIENEKKQRR